MLRLRLGYTIMGAGIAVSLVSAVMLVAKLLVGTAIAFGVAVLLFYGGAILMARAGTPGAQETAGADGALGSRGRHAAGKGVGWMGFTATPARTAATPKPPGLVHFCFRLDAVVAPVAV